MSTHIKIDRCDLPVPSKRRSYEIGDLWQCDCGKTWRWQDQMVEEVGFVPCWVAVDGSAE